MILKNRKILIGVSGSIAAYKIPFLVRLLIKAGAEVKVIMTDSARDFVSILTLATLSKNKVLSNFYSKETGQWENHVELALWADAIVIAPASANTIAKMANAICDNLLIATYLSAKCKVIVAPAMDLDMYKNAAFVRNLDYLASTGVEIIEAVDGELASGLEGKGRMAEPETIHKYIISKLLYQNSQLKGVKVLVTAGPTREALDPVRYITNHSSGKMGYAIAQEFLKRGAMVTIVSGPVYGIEIEGEVQIVNVNSADEMYAESRVHFSDTEIAIFSAAVADYKPAIVNKDKIKKADSTFALEMTKNVDIAFEFGKLKSDKQISIGFALETNNEEANALSKLTKKNFDFVVLNSMNDKAATFGYDTNKITIFKNDQSKIAFGLKTKSEVAIDIVDEIENLYKYKKSITL
ncbi:MAG: bifunctional phosphopantothenoylcysteine decarboxylase/phosphopantothenate--cysteine ligase CoaBC [Bacteroidota bacterium]|nr:bifunctional phosphopantothenoylcysteine decarboxylase/phosphopantothenate--cysteine ligase CoaBC [Bacteroidota bacterium]